MGLGEYNRKRNFALTREPPGEEQKQAPSPEAPAERPRAFVIQKHAATRLHYDFRLELGGVLKSWSVPKGPSLDPAVKRLAMQTEDHPLAYAEFEGIIPQGQYGGGTVLLWDRGTWEPQEADPHQAFAAGNLKFFLKGSKLRGGFALVRIKPRGSRRGDDDGRNWLLIKEKDAETRPEAAGIVTEERAESVATRRTLEEIAGDRTHVWHSNRTELDLSGISGPADQVLPPVGLVRGPKPKRRRTAVADEGWLHEIAVAGERLLARSENGEVTLFGPDGKVLPAAAAAKRKAIADAVRLLPSRALIVDGVLTAVGPDGHADPKALAKALAGVGPTQLAYYLFDLPFVESRDLTELPLVRRKELLHQLLGKVAERTCLRYLDHVDGAGADFYREACRLGIPAVLSRRADSPYNADAGWITVACAATAPKPAGPRRRRRTVSGTS
ncbi:MAG TPA: DNA polymerase ligase N-terminal domain-containing protein [Polyangia bacterium]|nr:DNA polymerase ligase N-terminal domain-containing protein [Polyangia bacterium]